MLLPSVRQIGNETLTESTTSANRPAVDRADTSSRRLALMLFSERTNAPSDVLDAPAVGGRNPCRDSSGVCCDASNHWAVRGWKCCTADSNWAAHTALLLT